VNHVPVNVGEAALETVVVEGQALVVEAEEVQAGCLEVVGGDDVLNRFVEV